MSSGESTAAAPERPSARTALRRSVLLGSGLAVGTGHLTHLCINTLARPGELTGGAGILLCLSLAHVAGVLFLYRRNLTETLRVDAVLEAEVRDPEALERSFAHVVNIPRFWATRSFLWFVIAGLNFSLTQHLLDPGAFPLDVVRIRMMGTVSGAFLYAVFLFFLLRSECSPMRHWLAGEFVDPQRARDLVQPIPLRLKLMLCTTGTLVVAMLYGVTLASVRADRTAEATAVHLGGVVLEAMAGGDAAAVDSAKRLGLVVHLLEADPGRDPALTALAGHLAPFEIAYLLDRGLASGDSLGVDSDRHFAWRRTADDRLLVSVTPAATFGGLVPGWSTGVLIFLVVVLAATVRIAWLMASDMERAVRRLSEAVERVSSGDLRRGRPLVREDELGTLAGGIDHMAASLGAMIIRVRGTADRVDSAAGEIAAASADLMNTAQEQQAGAQTLRAALLGVTGQVDGISASARELTTSVEEGGTSIVELGKSGQHLDESANLLSEKVEEVASAIAELIRSVRDVLENTENLSGHAVDTSSSMEEMAASLREVDTNAVETARLSQGVVERAEDGREKVRETLKGMESIRETTETARTVIRGLGSRTDEIGAIVNVIDDVAEETNLLALNAAIIAAQAGENGRAFSVVADEIKKLADRVLSSTKEIEHVIRSVQEEAANAVGAMEDGAGVVESGVHQAAEAGEALDAITESARSSGTRIGEIVTAVNEQTRAAGHVVSLMERVRVGVDQIRRAGEEQDRGNEAILATTEVLSEIARRVRTTTGEQAAGSARMAEGVDAVREAVLRISAALAEQSMDCGAAEAEVRELESRTQAHGELAHALENSVQTMRTGAERLRDAVESFRT